MARIPVVFPKPISATLADLSKELSQMNSAVTKLAGSISTVQTERAKHLPANIQRIMSAASLTAPASGKFTLAAVDKALAGMSLPDRIRAKSQLHAAGLLPA